MDEGNIGDMDMQYFIELLFIHLQILADIYTVLTANSTNMDQLSFFCIANNHALR